MVTVRRSLIVPVLVATAVALLGAIAGAQTTPSPQERVANAVDATVAAGSARFEGAIEGEDGAEVLTFSGALGLDGLDGELGVGFDGADEIATRAVDGTYFIEVASLADVLFGEIGELPAEVRSKEWVRVDPRDLARVGFGVSGADPAAQLAMLRAMTRVEEVGTEDVLGEPAKHYRGVVDLARALRQAPRAERARLEPAFDSFAGRRVPIDVWLDASDRLRRFDADVQVQALEGGDDDVAGTLSATYFDFGAEVSADAPPSRTVIGFDPFLEAVREAAAPG